MTLPKFRDPKLLERALTHSSYVNEHNKAGPDNERLEFLGDSVLGFICAEMLYRELPDKPEGVLTRLRSALVRNEKLAEIASHLKLPVKVRLGRGELAEGGRSRAPILGSALEAVIGAYYLDSGIEATRTWLEPLLRPMLAMVLNEQSDLDNKSRFQEWAQGVLGVTPSYTVAPVGHEHERKWMAEVFVGGQLYGRGEGGSKRGAQQAAATDALNKLDLLQ
jgi:ribonuclease-3